MAAEENSKQEANAEEATVFVSFNGVQMEVPGGEIAVSDLRKLAIADDGVEHIEDDWSVSLKESDGKFRELEDEEIVILESDKVFSCVNDELASCACL